MHLIQFRQIIRDAEIAYAISPVVRRHRLSAEETEKFLLELRIPRAANVAQIEPGKCHMLTSIGPKAIPYCI
jgi:hypothetical protein